MKNVKSIVAGVLLSLLAASAHAEGNYSNMKFDFLIYAMVALAVLAAQGIYVLCMGSAYFGTRLLRLLGLAVVDVIAIFVMYLLTLETRTLDLDAMSSYVLVVIPGFLFIAMLKAYISSRDQA